MRSHRRFGTAKWIVPDELRAAANGNGRCPIRSISSPPAPSSTSTRPRCPRSSAAPSSRTCTAATSPSTRWPIRLDPRHWGELLDFYGGKKDLEDGIIRVLHSLSFVEDPTRILRAARFEQRFGFQIEPRTEKLIADARDLLARVSGERVRHELELIMAEAEPERALCRLDELGVLALIHPSLHCDAWFRKAPPNCATSGHAGRRPGEPSRRRTWTLGADALPRLHLALLTYHLSDEGRQEFVERFRIVKEAARPAAPGARACDHAPDRLWPRTTSSRARSWRCWTSRATRRACCSASRPTRGWCGSVSTSISAGSATCTRTDRRRSAPPGIAPGPIYRQHSGTPACRPPRRRDRQPARKSMALAEKLASTPARMHVCQHPA